MKYLLSLGDREIKADIEAAGPGHYRVTLDGETFAVSASRQGVRGGGGALFSILLGSLDANGNVLDGGRSFEADVDVFPDAIGISIQGEHFSIGAIDERRKRLRTAAAATGDSTGELHSPMPGKVVRILAKEGATVTRGQGVVVVEAMKMENELASPRDGVVKKIAVTEGQPVEAGALLAVIG